MRRLCACRPCKPGSVPGANPGPLSFIWDGSLLPPRATYPPASGEQPLTAGIHGLATHGTYGRATSLPPRWALTPPFHPYPPDVPSNAPAVSKDARRIAARTRAVILCYAPTTSRLSSCWLARCSVLPGLSSPGGAGGDKADLRGKDRQFGGKKHLSDGIFAPCGRFSASGGLWRRRQRIRFTQRNIR